LLKGIVDSKEYRSWGVVLAITIVVILIVYAIFSTSGPGKKLSRTAAQREAAENARERQADMQERAAEANMRQQQQQQVQRDANGNRRINVKKGQNIVVF